MDLEQWLALVLTAGGSAAVVFGSIETTEWLVGVPLPPVAKRWAAFILSALVPLCAYLGQLALRVKTFEWNGLFLVAVAAWGCSKLVHDWLERRAA